MGKILGLDGLPAGDDDGNIKPQPKLNFPQPTQQPRKPEELAYRGSSRKEVNRLISKLVKRNIPHFVVYLEDGKAHMSKALKFNDPNLSPQQQSAKAKEFLIHYINENF